MYVVMVCICLAVTLASVSYPPFSLDCGSEKALRISVNSAPKKGGNIMAYPEKLNILTYPDPFLTKTAAPVENIDEDLEKTARRMIDMMYKAPGVGLASMQVGIEKSFFVYEQLPGQDRQSPGVLINPRILETEGAFLSEREGCLSVPDFRADVKRYASVVVEGVDITGKPVRLERDDFLAVVLQHEIDHLHGVLFVDRLSTLKRSMFRRKYNKAGKTR